MKKNLLQFFHFPSLITFVILLAAEWSYSFLRPSVHFFDWAVYGAGLCASLLLWISVGEIFRLLPFLLQKICSMFLAVFITLLLVVNYYLYKEFGQFVTPQMLQFILDDPQYFLNYVQTYLLNGVGVFVLCVCAGLVWLWYPRKNLQKKRSLLRIVFACILPIVYLVVLNQLRMYCVEKNCQ